MNAIVLDANLAQQLGTVSQPVPLADAAGNVLGHFVPLIERRIWDAIPPEISEEELARRAHSGGKRYTTAEVIAHLESL